ncbi:hypothetical protein [Proteiniphilum sp.]|nr:hypothetical protein [Proteiniphilum sp.]MEA4917883.1 hypothetical protein [Proteiniphilum sp.]
MELAKGEYFFEEVVLARGILQLTHDAELKLFSTVPIAGPS